ncbi:MAG: Gfo/Idh/MocA family oxidoreductase [Kiritimatiellaeota bacterium]|nr:Gfo/Idh/MocA family oxidoreductase [Kiritimatiellota bacterium]
MSHFNRRDFVKGAALATASLALNSQAQLAFPRIAKVSPRLRKANEKINIGVVGVGGKGHSNWKPMYDWGENIVALCDVDRGDVEKGLAEVKERCPDAKGFSDYRKMFDACGKNLDAVIVSTPDHVHGAAGITALKLGCSVYVEKPLVRTIWEARYFEQLAKANGVATQMGNQGSSSNGLRRTVELLNAGIIGNMTEVHVWTNRPVWPQGITVEGSDPVPDNLDWDAWIGPAPMRPFKKDTYHKFKWRGFFDFGTGAFGDMACHTMNLPFRGLKLGAVTSAECIEVEGKNKDTYPSKSIVKLVYAAREKLPAVNLFWYDGNLKPSADIMPQVTATLGEVPGTGCLIVGDKGMLVSTNDYGEDSYIGFTGEEKMTSTKKTETFAHIPEVIPRNKGGQQQEFVSACKGEVKCYSDVDHSVPMLESMLVGCIAQQVEGKLTWDTKKQTFKNKEADALLKPYMRKGWEY